MSQQMTMVAMALSLAVLTTIGVLVILYSLGRRSRSSARSEPDSEWVPAEVLRPPTVEQFVGEHGGGSPFLAVPRPTSLGGRLRRAGIDDQPRDTVLDLTDRAAPPASVDAGVSPASSLRPFEPSPDVVARLHLDREQFTGPKSAEDADR